MQPAHSQFPEEAVEVNVLGAQLAGSGVAAVRDADGPANTEATLGEVESGVHRATDSVGRHPGDELVVDSAGGDAVADEVADWVVDETGDDGGTLAEDPGQATADVVLAAALPDIEGRGGADATLTRIEAEHHLAEGDDVVTALVCGTKCDAHDCSSRMLWALRAASRDKLAMV